MSNAATEQLTLRDTLCAAVEAAAPRATIIPNWWFERLRTVTVQHFGEQAPAIIAAARKLGYEAHHDAGRCVEIYVSV